MVDPREVLQRESYDLLVAHMRKNPSWKNVLVQFEKLERDL